MDSNIIRLDKGGVSVLRRGYVAERDGLHLTLY